MFCLSVSVSVSVVRVLSDCLDGWGAIGDQRRVESVLKRRGEDNSAKGPPLEAKSPNFVLQIQAISSYSGQFCPSVRRCVANSETETETETERTQRHHEKAPNFLSYGGLSWWSKFKHRKILHI